MNNNLPNQLNIDNLLKTKWAKQFDKKQLERIKVGLNQGLDVTIYADPKYDWLQMKEIRKKLESELNKND